MIPEIGHFSLVIALCISICLGTLPIVGAAYNIKSWVALARPAALGQFVFITLSFFCLAYAFITDDFSVQYVASHSNSLLPTQYKFSAIWGGHEGSLLLWVLMLSGWTLAVGIFSRNVPGDMVARVIAVMGLVMVGFLLFMLFTSSPFVRLIPAALDGRDLNPLLQDPGLVIHPPMLYMGYVGFSVAFSFAIAALLTGRFDAAWARWSRPWTTAAWALLTIGIALGSWWAYYELGWGGWWFWDPVENASFMPWLVGTALIHSLAVTEKRGAFKSWTVLLAIFAFSLSLLGTFLVRSGVLTSVHSFAADSERGTFILAFLIVVIGGSLALYAFRAPKISAGGSFEMVSKETFLLTNNVLFVVAAATVLLGTLAPLVFDALGLRKISIGAPWFNVVFATVMVPAVFLMAIAPIARWKKAKLPDLAIRLRWAFGTALAVGILLPVLMGRWSPMLSVGFFIAFWLMSSIIYSFYARIKRMKETTGKTGLSRLSRSYWGMQCAHFGIAVFIIGVTMVKGYETEKDIRMDVGDTVDIGGYTFEFGGVSVIQGPNYRANRGTIFVTKDGDAVSTMFPEKRVYTVQSKPMTEAAIDTGLFRDLYVSLGEPVSNGAWSVRVYHKPFIDWIWGGSALMALGGFLALSDRRYRLASRKKKLAAKEADDKPASPIKPEPTTTTE